MKAMPPKLRHSIMPKAGKVVIRRYTEGASLDQIAREVGFARETVRRYLHANGVPMRAAGGQFRKLSKEERVQIRIEQRREILRAAIPPWVPEALHNEFLRVGLARGEVDAARHVRRLKAESARAA